jgi:5-methylcytosine-specific restriction endonuclease McrA
VHADLAAQYRRAIADDTCRYCGGLAEHDDHYFPTSKGGRDFWWNLTRACGPCNRAKGSHCGTWFRLRTGSLTPT